MKDKENEITADMINEDMLMKYAIRVISGYDIEADSYNEATLFEEYKQKCIDEGIKFISLGEPDVNDKSFYYQFLQIGYRTFGAEFFSSLIQQNPEHMIQGTWSLIRGLEGMSDSCGNLEAELKKYKSLKLTKKQEEELKKLEEIEEEN